LLEIGMLFPCLALVVTLVPGLHAPQDQGGRWNALQAQLQAQVEQVREELELPGLVVSVGRGEAVLASAAAGVRALGDPAPVTVDDRFHVGSLAKPMTSTLVARLVERGRLAADDTLGVLLPELVDGTPYADVTVDQLLMHRGGVAPFLTFDDEQDGRYQGAAGGPSGQRLTFLTDVLASEPVADPGDAMHYSNAGYVLLGHLAEVVGEAPYEELMAREVWEPLAMECSGMGWPATAERPHQPLGHMPDDEGVIETQAVGSWDVGAYLAPAGDAHASAPDLVRFGLAHARGLAGEDGLLRADTVAWLHTVPEGLAPMPYARGWIVTPQGHLHAGSAGSFFAALLVFPDQQASVAVVANAGDPRVMDAAFGLAGVALQQLLSDG
jgi:D-alanyl-D-alanine carboxypeptidase